METLLNKLEEASERVGRMPGIRIDVSLEKQEIETIISLLKGGWVKVDKDNLPDQEVIAYRAGEESIVGYFNRYEDAVVCENLNETLFEPTHYKPFLPPTE